MDSSSADASRSRQSNGATQLGVRLLLVCHAEGMHDRYHHLGSENSGLTARGWEQSDVLAGWLRHREQFSILSSDSLLQSRLTAQRIGQALGLPVTVHRDLPLCPRDNWKLPGADREDPIRLRGLSMVSADELDPYADFHSALVVALDKLLEEHWGKSIALITCGDTIATLIRHLFGSHHIDIRLDHTSLSEIRYEGGHWRLAYVNRLDHLPVPELSPSQGQENNVEAPEDLEDLAQVVHTYNRVARVHSEQKRQDDLVRMRHLLDFAALEEGQDILDLGTGPGTMPLLLAEEGSHVLVGVDVSPAMLEQAEFFRLNSDTSIANRISYRLASAQSLPFYDKRFDVVICRLVLHHARKPDRILREIFRVLKPDGVLIMAELLSVDNPVKRATQNAIEERRNESHVAARSVEQYNKLITDAGLIIESRETVRFDRELEEWLASYASDKADGQIVREMIEAGLETDAAGIGARRQNQTIVFEQRMYYVRATRPDTS